MDHRIHLKKVKGRYYISLGSKGYKSTYDLDKALSEWVGKDSAVITFTLSPTEHTVRKVRMRIEDDAPVMDLYDPKSEELFRSVKQCPKMFNDYSMEKEFYINYSPEW